jgi:hypothetical protein
MRLLSVLMFVPALLLACSSPCQRLIDDDKTISTKSCNPADAGFTPMPTSFEFGSSTATVQQCTTALKSCSSQDQAYLDSYLTCIEAIPACTAENSDTAVAEPGNCVGKYISFLSEPCVTAFGGSSSDAADGGN